jgi:hypothetical protein
MLSRPLHDRIVVDGLVAGVSQPAKSRATTGPLPWVPLSAVTEEVCHGWTLRRA